MLTPEDTAEIAAIVTAAEQRTVEAMRGMQTEILKGIEAFAHGNFARMPMLEMRQRPPQ